MMTEEEEDETLFDQEGLLGRKDDDAVHERRDWRRRVLKTAALSMSFLCLGLCISIPGPTLLDLGRRVGRDTEHMTFVFTARSIGYLIGSLAGGVLFDFFDRQILLFYMIAATSVATVGIPWCTALITLSALICIQGVALGVLDTGGNVFCIKIWGQKSAPFMQVLHFAFGVGAFLAPLLARPFLQDTTVLSYNGTNTEFYPVNFKVPPIGSLTGASRYTRDLLHVKWLYPSYEFHVREHQTSVGGGHMQAEIEKLLLNLSVGRNMEKFGVSRLHSLRLTKPAHNNGDHLNTHMESSASFHDTGDPLVHDSVGPLNPHVESSAYFHDTGGPQIHDNVGPLNPHKESSTHIDDSGDTLVHDKGGLVKARGELKSLPNDNGDHVYTTSWMYGTQDNLTNNVETSKSKFLPSGHGLIENLNRLFHPGQKQGKELLFTSRMSSDDRGLGTPQSDNNGLGTSQSASSNREERADIVRARRDVTGSAEDRNNTMDGNLTETFVDGTQENKNSSMVAAAANSTSAAVIPSSNTSATVSTSTTRPRKPGFNNGQVLSKAHADATAIDHDLLDIQKHKDPAAQAKDGPGEQPTAATIAGSSAGILSLNCSGDLLLQNLTETNISSTAVTPDTDSGFGTSHEPTRHTSLTEDMNKEQNVASNTQTTPAQTSDLDMSAQEHSRRFRIKDSLNTVNISYTNVAITSTSVVPIVSSGSTAATTVPTSTVQTTATTVPIAASTTSTATSATTPHLKLTNMTTDPSDTPKHSDTVSAANKSLNSNHKYDDDDDGFGGGVFAVLAGLSKIQIAYSVIAIFLLLNAGFFLLLYCRDRRLSLPLTARTHEDLTRPPDTRCFVTSLLVLLFFFFFTYVGMEVTFGGLLATFVVYYPHDVWTPAQAATLTALFWGCLALGRCFAIFIARSFKPPCMMVTNLSLTVVGALLLSFGVHLSSAVLWAGTVILGLGMSSLFPTAISWANSYYPLTGRATSVFIAGSGIGEMAVPLVTGYLYERVDRMSLMYMTLALSIILSLLYVGLQTLVCQKGEPSPRRSHSGFMRLSNSEDPADALDMDTIEVCEGGVTDITETMLKGDEDKREQNGGGFASTELTRLVELSD